jgi:catechol 2,3-dioxygenase-like lactoylglutathione lyase family enzyme
MAQAAAKVQRMPVEFHRTIAILRMFDIEKAKEFYVDFLGFKVDWEHRFEAHLPLYMQISRGELVFHLSEHHGDSVPGTAVFISLSGLKEFHREISIKGYRSYRPSIQRVPWNADMMEVQDPFGNRIRFNHGPAKKPSRQTRIGKGARPTATSGKPIGSRA